MTLLPGNFDTFRVDVPSGLIEEIKAIILNVLNAQSKLSKRLKWQIVGAQDELLDSLEADQKYSEIEKEIGARNARKAVAIALNEISI